MAQVCKWLSLYLCVRDSPKSTDKIAADGQVFDAVIVWKESPKERKSGISYEVILAPAPAPEAVPRATSPPKERPISQEFIEKKLKDAEERRQSAEMAKLAGVIKDKERAVEAAKRVEELNDSFSKETKEKLTSRLESMEEKKQEQIKQLQSRLQDHAKRVEIVRKSSEDYYANLKDKIDRKIQAKTENREAQLKNIQDRLREHEKHIQEVMEASTKFSKITEMKMIQKMENHLRNREDQLKQLQDRLQDHEKHREEVRGKKLTSSNSQENCS